MTLEEQAKILRKFPQVEEVEVISKKRVRMKLAGGIKSYCGALKTQQPIEFYINLDKKIYFHDYEFIQIISRPTKTTEVRNNWAQRSLHKRIFDSQGPDGYGRSEEPGPLPSGWFVCWGAYSWTRNLNEHRLDKDIISIVETFIHFLRQ